MRNNCLDTTCAVHDGYHMFNGRDEDFQYVYWSERLLELHNFMQNPPPRTRFQRWIKWQTTESNSFIVAMIALMITIIVAILTLGLTGFQTWISWQAWKHPLQS